MRRAARAIIVEDGKLLVLERRRTADDGRELHYISIPGGQIEEGEQPEEAVIRELQEELCIDIEVGNLIARVRTKAVAWYQSEEHLLFACKRVSGVPKFNIDSIEAQRDDGQEYAAAWRELNKIESEPKLHPIYRSVVVKLLPYLRARKMPLTPIDIDASDLL